MPNFASRNHSGISYSRSDSRVPWKGPLRGSMPGGVSICAAGSVAASNPSACLRVMVMICSLSIYARSQEAAIDRNALSGDERGRIRGEENGGPGELWNFAEALHGSAHEEF